MGSLLIFIPSLLFHFTQIYIVNKFGFEIKGEFELYNSILLISTSALSLNIYTAITLFVSKQQELPFNVRYLSIITGIPQVFLVIVVLYFFAEKGNLSEKILIISLAVYLNHLTNVKISIFNGLQKLLLSRFILVLGPFITFIFILNVTKSPGITIYIFLLPYLVNFLVAELLSLYHIKGLSISKIKFHLFNRTWKIFLVSILQILYQRLFVLYIIRYEELKEVGSFSLAGTFSQMLLIPITYLTLTIISSVDYTYIKLKKQLIYSLIFLITTSTMFLYFISNISYFFKLLPLLRSFDFLGKSEFLNDVKILIFTIPFQGLILLIIAFTVKMEKISLLFLVNMFMSIPMLILIYNIVSIFNINHEIAISFLISTIINSLTSLLIFYFAKNKYSYTIL